MAARSTTVTIHNELAMPLCHVSDSLEGGEWTDPLVPPKEVPPGQTMWFQSESDGVAASTEGHATQTVGTSPDPVGIHWNNPHVGTNFYEQSITRAYGVYSTGGKGDNTEIVYHAIPDDRVAVPGATDYRAAHDPRPPKRHRSLDPELSPMS